MLLIPGRGVGGEERGTGNGSLRTSARRQSAYEFEMADKNTEKGLGTNFEHSISVNDNCRIY